jgi:hypothetical protein
MAFKVEKNSMPICPECLTNDEVVEIGGDLFGCGCGKEFHRVDTGLGIMPFRKRLGENQSLCVFWG